MNKYHIHFPHHQNEFTITEAKISNGISKTISSDMSEISYVLRLDEATKFALKLLDVDNAIQFCEKALEAQLRPSSSITPDARMKESLLDQIEELENVSGLYYTFYIDKTDKQGNVVGKRKINAPEGSLKELQRQVVYFLRDMKGIKESDYAYAYVKGRSYSQGAQIHADAKSYHYANFDLANFFPSITPRIVRWALKEYDLTDREIDAIVKVSSWYDKEIGKVCFPQGSVTSPYLSNIVFYKIDLKLVKMLENKFNQKMVFTRYSDDITISYKKPISKGRLKASLIKLFESHGFKLKDEKTKFTTIRGKNRVTGLTVNKDHNVTIGYKRKRWLKQKYHRLIVDILDGNGTAEQAYIMLGELAHLYSVEPNYHKFIIKKYNELFKKDVFSMLKEQII